MNFLRLFLFSFFLLLIIIFFFWSKILWISLVLLVVLDFFTTRISLKYLEGKLSEKVMILLKYLGLILLPVSLIIFIRTFFIDVYHVPSSSMERTLLPGNYVIIDKFSYGAKVPKHIRNIPVIGKFFNTVNNYDLYRPLTSFKDFNRDDIVVFKAVDNTDKLLVKRLIGMPGDTLIIKSGNVFINSVLIEEKKEYSHNYAFMGDFTMLNNFSNDEFEKLKEKDNYEKINLTKPSYHYFLFPSSKQEDWTKDNYGKVVIPKKGMKIKLTDENKELYHKNVMKFEKIDLTKSKEESYVFKLNYYFMLGDNRHNSIDSRSFGFVPDNYVQGKLIYKF